MARREAFFINNVTDGNYYFVETGEVVHEDWLCLTSCKFEAQVTNGFLGARSFTFST